MARPTTRSSWTLERKDELRRLWRDGLPIHEIAALLNATAIAARIKAERMGLPKRRSGALPRVNPGDRFGRLTVMERSKFIPGVGDLGIGTTLWLTRCDCGTPPKIVRGRNLLSGDTRSCGCLHRERVSALRNTFVGDLA